MTQPANSLLKRLFIKEGKLHPFWRAVIYFPLWLLVAGLGQVPALILYARYLAARQPNPTLVTAQLIDLAGWPIIVGIGAFLGEVLLLLLVTFLFVRFLDRRPFSSFGFALSPGWLREVGLGLGLGVGMVGVVVLIEWATGLATVEGLHSAPELGAIAPLFVLGFLVYFALQGTGEEIPMRGYLLQTLEEWLGPVAATLITAIGFGLLHIFNFLYVGASPLALVNISLFGVVAAYAYLVTRRLWLPSALHAGWNFALGPLASLPVSGLAYRGLLRTVVGSGGQLFTGGDFGPEGGLLATLALLGGWGVIWLWNRGREKPTLSSQGARR